MNVFLAVLLLYDWRRVRWSALAIFSIPYLAGAALCLWYIAQAPGIFAAQYQAATGYRMSGLAAILTREFRDFGAPLHELLPD